MWVDLGEWIVVAPKCYCMRVYYSILSYFDGYRLPSCALECSLCRIYSTSRVWRRFMKSLKPSPFKPGNYENTNEAREKEKKESLWCGHLQSIKIMESGNPYFAQVRGGLKRSSKVCWTPSLSQILQMAIQDVFKQTPTINTALLASNARAWMLMTHGLWLQVSR